MTVVHVQDAENDPARRAFTRTELQAFFDHADDQVATIRSAGRKGWLPAVRDAALFKIAYAYGLRRNEVRMLEVADFGRNPHAAAIGTPASATSGTAKAQGLPAQAAQRARRALSC